MEDDILNDPEFQELIRDYLSYLAENLPEVKDNLSNHDFQQVRNFGHNVKGSGGGYGFDDLSKLGHQIEQAAEKEDDPALSALLAEFEESINEKRSEYST